MKRMVENASELEKLGATIETTTTDNVSTTTFGGNVEVDGTIKGLENIVDEDGNHRFLEGGLILTNGWDRFSLTYGKWALSAHHLEIVFMGLITSGEFESKSHAYIDCVNIPQFILDKIEPQDDYEGVAIWTGFSSKTSNIQEYVLTNQVMWLGKRNNNLRMSFKNFKIPETSENSVIRVEFNLLID